MRNRRVDGNDDIQQRDDGGRIHKILEIVAEMNDTRMRAQHCRIIAAQLALEADELDVGIRQELRELR